MDGENNGNPYEQMDDLGGFPIIFGLTPLFFGQINENKTSNQKSEATKEFHLRSIAFLVLLGHVAQTI